MSLIIPILYFAAVALLKLVLAIIGLVAVPFTHPFLNPIWGNREDPEAPAWYRPGQPNKKRDYYWRALRNPVNNMRYWFVQPPLMKAYLNPDVVVRAGVRPAWSRYIRTGRYFEYWYLREYRGKYFEFRIGWKFSGVPGFGPTLQLRYGG